MGNESRHLDIRVGGDETPSDESASRRWLGIHFECCNVYARVWRNSTGTAYVGFCPHCTKQVRLPIGPGGTDARFFSAR